MGHIMHRNKKKEKKTKKEGRMSRVDYRLTFIDIMWQYHSSMCDIKKIYNIQHKREFRFYFTCECLHKVRYMYVWTHTVNIKVVC